jgi:hypothetical protein
MKKREPVKRGWRDDRWKMKTSRKKRKDNLNKLGKVTQGMVTGKRWVIAAFPESVCAGNDILTQKVDLSLPQGVLSSSYAWIPVVTATGPGLLYSDSCAHGPNALAALDWETVGLSGVWPENRTSTDVWLLWSLVLCQAHLLS